MTDMTDTTTQDIRRVANLLAYEQPLDEIRRACSEMSDERFFLIYHAAAVFLKFERAERAALDEERLERLNKSES